MFQLGLDSHSSTPVAAERTHTKVMCLLSVYAMYAENTHVANMNATDIRRCVDPMCLSWLRLTGCSYIVTLNFIFATSAHRSKANPFYCEPEPCG
jgi:hypothetical protein